MPKYTFKFSRTYTITESFVRTFEAETAEQAQLLADAEADKANSDCPDDCAEDEGGTGETTSFYAERIDPHGQA